MLRLVCSPCEVSIPECPLQSKVPAAGIQLAVPAWGGGGSSRHGAQFDQIGQITLRPALALGPGRARFRQCLFCRLRALLSG